MKRSIVAIVMGSLLVASGITAAEVTNVGLNYQDGATVVRIDIDGQVRFTHSTEIPKNGRPNRVIVDILSASHQLGAKEFLSLPKCFVTGIRSSQFSVKPEQVVRVVLDVKGAPIYRVDSDNKSITLYINDKKSKAYPAWSSTAVIAAANEKPKVKTVARKTTPDSSPSLAIADKSKKSAAKANQAIENDRMASLEGKPAAAKPVASKPVESKSIVKAKAKPALAVSTPKVKQPQPTIASKPASKVVKKSAPETKVDGKVVKKQIPLPQSMAPMPVVASKAKTPAVKKHTPTVIAGTDPVVKAAPLKVQKKTESVVSTKTTHKKPAVKAATADKPSPKKAQTIPAAVNKPTTPAKAKSKKNTKPVPSSVPSGKGKKDYAASKTSGVVSTAPALTEPAAVKAKPAMAKVTKVPSVSTKPSSKAPPKKAASKKVTSQKSQGQKALAKKVGSNKKKTASALTKKQSKSKPVAKVNSSSTSRFRRSRVSNKIKGTMVAQFPKRLVIKYKSSRYRDPFKPLIDDQRIFNSPIDNQVPNVEGLRLVGIIESDDAGNRALFEDNIGYSYMLKSGDKVRNGYVLRVEADRVFFQIFEYGWSRTMALRMEEY